MRASLLLPLAVMACSSTVVPTGGLPDAAALPDAPTIDLGAPDTGIPADAPDGALPASDVVAPQVDVNFPGPDVTGPEMSLAGRWRIVRYQFRRADGSTVSLTDENLPFTDPESGMTTPVRANGVLTLGPTRLSMTLGVLAGEHIYSTGVMMGRDEFSATGFAVPGLLDARAGRFDLPGGQTTYEVRELGPDRLRVRFNPGDGSVFEFARAAVAPVLTRINALGAAELLRPMQQRPMMHPRAALLWVRPGVRGLIETNGVALGFSDRWASFPLTLAKAPPRDARFTLAGVELAAAMIAVYDDRNDDQVMNPGTDALRGLAQLTLAWRGEGARPPEPTFARTAFVDLQPGYQYAWRARDLSTGGITLVPFDNTRPLSPDVPVSPTELDPLMLESTWR